MEIQRINHSPNFKNNYTSEDLYRLEQKLDGLQAELNRNDLDSFYKDLPKERRLPMPLGVPPYAMNGMMGVGVGPNGMGMMPPMGGMMPPRAGMYGSQMWNAGMMPPPQPTGAIYSAPTGMPPSNLSGQPPRDTFCPRK